MVIKTHSKLDRQPNPQNGGIDVKQANLAWKTILKASQIGLISHRNPDPDSLGGNLAFNEVLTKLGKKVSSFCLDPLPTNLGFFPAIEKIESNFQPDNFDLIISVDCGSISQIGYDQEFPNLLKKDLINIDHHASNNYYGKINIVNPNFSSTCEIIYHLFSLWEIPLTPSIATYFLAGLYYDTGSFMHANTTAEVLSMAEDLIKHGASQQKIIRHLYKNFSLNKFHLWGETLANIKLTEKNTVVAVVTPDILNHSQACQEDLSGVIAYLTTVKDNDYAVLVNQDDCGQIKGSLRTNQNHINVSEMAESLGGGGHKRASGFGFPGRIYKETIWKIV